MPVKSKKPKPISPWVTHVRQYQRKHGGTYGEAMVGARATYIPVKTPKVQRGQGAGHDALEFGGGVLLEGSRIISDGLRDEVPIVGHAAAEVYDMVIDNAVADLGAWGLSRRRRAEFNSPAGVKRREAEYVILKADQKRAALKRSARTKAAHKVQLAKQAAYTRANGTPKIIGGRLVFV